MTDLLQYINQIDQSVADAEIDVLESLIASYDKSIMIIQESADNADLSAFEIFQEGEKWDKFKEDTKDPVFGKKGEGIVKRLLMIIPRLIQKIVALIRKLFTNNKSFEQKMDKDMQQMKQQAETVVAEQLTDDQSDNLAKRISDLNDEVEKSYDEKNKSEKDFSDTRDMVKDSISERHKALHEYIRHSVASSQKKADDSHKTGESIDPFGNSKALSELRQMLDNMDDDDTLHFNSNGSVSRVKVTPKMVKKIDEKNPGLIDDLIDELGGKPRKKVKLEDVEIEIQHTTFFGTSIGQTNRMRNQQNGTMKIYTEPLIDGFKKLKSQHYSLDAKKEYADLLEEIYNGWLEIIDYITHDEIVGQTIYVKFGEAVHVFEQMKHIFENDVKESKQSCDVINELIKEIKDEYDQFNETVIPGQMGQSQQSLLIYLKEISTVLVNLVEIVTGCLEGWKLIWNTNYNAIQNALKDDNFKSDSHPTLHLPFNPVAYPTPSDGEWKKKFTKDIARWKHLPMPRPFA